MQKKTILVTGATDGIGLLTAQKLRAQGHTVLLHGRNAAKLADVQQGLRAQPGAGEVAAYRADLSKMDEVVALAKDVLVQHNRLDVLINNAGIFRVDPTRTGDGLDVRFAVNTLAPYLLTQRLMPALGRHARVVNLSSAAQAPVDLEALAGRAPLNAMGAYAQSKLALTMWSCHMGRALQATGPMVVAVNPASMLGSKMVKEAFGVDGGDIGIGADILVRAALSDAFAAAHGLYYDNDARRFAPPHPDALDAGKVRQVVDAIEALLRERVA